MLWESWFSLKREMIMNSVWNQVEVTRALLIVAVYFILFYFIWKKVLSHGAGPGNRVFCGYLAQSCDFSVLRPINEVLFQLSSRGSYQSDSAMLDCYWGIAGNSQQCSGGLMVPVNQHCASCLQSRALHLLRVVFLASTCISHALFVL